MPSSTLPRPSLGRPRGHRLEEVGGNLFPNRVASRLSGIGRRAALRRREELFSQLAQLDDDFITMGEERLDILDELEDLRDELWPEIPWQRGRRPPVIAGPPLPAATRRAIILAGHPLRHACLQILERHGALALPDVHAWIHRYGYVVGSDRPVKVLADALGHEHDAGRAVRVARGVYALAPGTTAPPSRPGDPLVPHGDRPLDVDPLVDPPMRPRPDPTAPGAPGAPGARPAA